jgi:DNA processing protein
VVGAIAAGPTEADELRATLILQRVPGVGDVGLDPLVERFGSASGALRASNTAFDTVIAGAGGRRADPVLWRRVDEALSWCAAHGIAAVHRWAPEYPTQLAPVPNPPGALFLKGDTRLLDRPIVTVVGSRRATEYGRRVAREVAAVAVRAGAVVASGLALGVDGEAHRAALDAQGKTIAVLGSGVARPYPRTHAQLFRRIAEEGLLVSEYLPHEPPLKHHFPRRNRTLAAIARVVVVVEAAEQSGALNTAGHATDLGRELLAVPGSIYAPLSQGTNELLRRAHPLLSAETVLEHLGLEDVMLPLFPNDPPDDVGPEALRVWDVLAEAPLHVDEVARAARLGSGPALAALSLLEVGGWVRQEAGARFARGTGA